jgi:S1-C subfamily serine protease
MPMKIMRKQYHGFFLLLVCVPMVFGGCSLQNLIPQAKKPVVNQQPAAPVSPTVNETSPTSPEATPAPVVTAPVITPVVVPPPAPLTKENAFKGIVQIKTMALQSYESLGEHAEGSGVIISSDGFLLTNSHVVTVEDDMDKSEKNAVYGICLTTNTSQKPDCSHLATLVKKDKDLDIALLRFNDAGEFPFLAMASSSSSASTTDEVTALGYPGIGQDTITLTKGIVSGKLDKYDKKWIKTDAVVSFGSSGGAAIDKNGQVLGITTAGYSDTLGELGYVIDISSISDWIKGAEASYQSIATVNPLNERALNLMKKQKDLETSNVFNGDLLPISITHPDGWDFLYQSEDSISVFNKKEKDKSGAVQFSFKRKPFILGTDDIIPNLDKELDDQSILSAIKINKTQDVKAGNLNGKKITISAGGKIEEFYFFLWQEYMIEVSYGYGDNDRDKETVNGIINSLKAEDRKQPFNEIFAYRSDNPLLGLTSIKGWPLIVSSEKSAPFLIEGKNTKGTFISTEMMEKDATMQAMKNQEILDNLKQKVDYMNQAGAMLDLKAQINSSSADFNLNSEFPHAIKMEMTAKKKSNNELVSRDIVYYVNLSDKYAFSLHFVYYGKDDKAYKAAVADFDKIAKTLTAKPALDSDNDGLSDADEIKSGTDPHNPDSDGDGYLDGSEVVNGYNPLAK